jgi:hypothetical protein
MESSRTSPYNKTNQKQTKSKSTISNQMSQQLKQLYSHLTNDTLDEDEVQMFKNNYEKYSFIHTGSFEDYLKYCKLDILHCIPVATCDPDQHIIDEETQEIMDDIFNEEMDDDLKKYEKNIIRRYKRSKHLKQHITKEKYVEDMLEKMKDFIWDNSDVIFRDGN